MKKCMFVISFFVVSFSVTSQTKKKTTLIWDTSYSMIDKNISKEIHFLNTYFSKNPNTSVQLIKFSNEVILNESFDIKEGKWERLKNELFNSIYDGVSSFNNLLNVKGDEILFFTDGNESIDDFPAFFSNPVQIISSTGKAENSKLKKIAKLSNGQFIDLSNEQIVEVSNRVSLKGVVEDISGPLSNVTVISKQERVNTVTNEKGEYEITITKGDIVEFRYIGKNTLRVKALKSKTKNVLLTDGRGVLDEVTVVSERKEMVNTGNRLENKDKIGYSTQSIGEEDISHLDTDVKRAVKGKFSGLKIQNNTATDDVDLSQFLGRGNNMSILGNQYGLIVMDGIIISETDSGIGNSGNGSKGIISKTQFVDKTTHINPDNVKSITYLKGLAATNKYGTLGVNGVLLITTKTGSPDNGVNSKKKIKLGTTPTYNEDVVAISNNLPYMSKLIKAKNIDEAFNIYLDQRKLNKTNVDFFFNVATYFKNWGNEYLLKRILSNVLELVSKNDFSTLLALVYKYEENHLYSEAIVLYKRLVEYNPKVTQLYRNLAIAYKRNGQFKEAQNVYNNIDRNLYKKASDFSGLLKSINYEYKNLVALNKDSIQLNLVRPFFKDNITYKTRIVFEWNEFDAEFDLQIVNPQKRYFNWLHTEKDEKIRLENEKNHGYGLEEFFITSKDIGKWIFNISYLGKLTGNNNVPTYFRITVYHNFGKANQTKEEKIISLVDLNKKLNILTLDIK
ncbi:tetratricopeptide repeat protein [Lutibacter sp. Hel_I_33_5]|uniref:tetratricopeptide repeat protein n=1 Tax=Lutibacter sp. Hel_I_33_5 TaxID=1566289 RepID=UPI0011A4E5DF|nr:carboxypeptidase-like regulatory domain-containing protein [Lutibacter sp. Hel_I_33_5]TVZ55771.1 tetratricopeptide repeat protein [Lutibacter sp. Hel_I_33_5]